MSQSVLIVGNGISRLLYEDVILGWDGEVWGCNNIYRERAIAPKLTLLAGHTEVLAEAAEYRDKHGLKYQTLCGLLGQKGFDRPATCPSEFRKNSGTTLVAQALHDGFDAVLCGFDMGGPDIWSPGMERQHKQVWVRRMRDVVRRYGPSRVRFVGFDHLPFLEMRKHDHRYAERYLKGKPHIPDPGYVAVHQMIYGGSGVMRGERLMRVRFTKDGYETDMNEDLAKVYADKGKVELLEEASPRVPIEGVEQIEVVADQKVTARMSIDTLRQIAALREREGRGIEGWESMKRTELIEALKG